MLTIHSVVQRVFTTRHRLSPAPTPRQTAAAAQGRVYKRYGQLWFYFGQLKPTGARGRDPPVGGRGRELQALSNSLQLTSI